MCYLFGDVLADLVDLGEVLGDVLAATGDVGDSLGEVLAVLAVLAVLESFKKFSIKFFNTIFECLPINL
jgi:hypothetical protein